jgi:hypothetical protein
VDEAGFFDVMAEAAEAQAVVFRRHAAILRTGQAGPAGARSVLEAARAVHPMMGEWQMKILIELEKADRAGTSAGEIGRAIDYNTTDTHIALRGLVGKSLVVKDTSTMPHIFRLADWLLEIAERDVA